MLRNVRTREERLYRIDAGGLKLGISALPVDCMNEGRHTNNHQVGVAVPYSQVLCQPTADHQSRLPAPIDAQRLAHSSAQQQAWSKPALTMSFGLRSRSKLAM